MGRWDARLYRLLGVFPCVFVRGVSMPVGWGCGYVVDARPVYSSFHARRQQCYYRQIPSD